MSKYTGSWPICTYPGCTCARQQGGDDDVPALMAEWVSLTGHAFCAHHEVDSLPPHLVNLGVPDTFPCDIEVAP